VELAGRLHGLSEESWLRACPSTCHFFGQGDKLPVVRLQIGQTVGHVDGLFTYPVKSTKAVQLAKAATCSFGFVDDRQMCIVDGKKLVVTQRMIPALAEIAVDVEHLGIGIADVTLSSPKCTGSVRFRLPMQGPIQKVFLYKAAIEALDCGDDAAAWLTTLLQSESPTHACCSPPYRLVRMASGTSRKCSKSTMAPLCDHKVADHDEVALADFAPLLLTNSASLSALNAQLPAGHRVPMDRFRPNIVIRTSEGRPAWEEDHWGRVSIGDVELRCITRDPRCVMPTVNQKSGEAGFRAALDHGDEKLTSEFAEPLATLKRTRPWPRWPASSRDKPPEFGGTGGQPNGLFGIYCGFGRPDEAGSVCVGDPVVLLE